MRNRTTSRRRTGLVTGLGLTLSMGLLAGCESNSFFDPSEVGAYPKEPLVVPIIDTLDPAVEQPDEIFAQATDPRPEDLQAEAADYAIGAADALSISITDLVGPGVETVLPPRRVTETGFISLPYIGQVKASGLTEAQLEQAIAQAYRDANLIPNAQVTVTIVEARARTFTIFGAVAQAGEYPILRHDLRVLDALTLARDTTSPVGIDTIYIIRRLDTNAAPLQPNGVQPPAPVPADPGADPLAPRSQAAPVPAAPSTPVESSVPVTPSGETDWAKLLGQGPQPNASRKPVYLADGAIDAPASANQEGRVIVIDGQQVDLGAPPAETVDPLRVPEVQMDAPAMRGQFEGFGSLREPDDVRVIRIPLDDLRRGEMRYNIVIRPRDFIFVPQPTIGEYYMGGHVARVGVYSLTARNITLTQAIIAAGMMDQVAVPQRTEIRRRLGRDRDLIARVDLAAIFAGKAPDIYLKPDDRVMVGTAAWAPFWAAIRNGFRTTYGFGFLYDRNYAD